MWKWEPDGEAKGVIVMVHGALEHHRRYGWLIEMWRQAGFQVIMGDLPGHGLTTRSRRGHVDSFDEYTDAVKEWVEAAYQFELPVFLLGHSMGGLISIRLLQKENLNLAGVILSSPCVDLVKRPAKILNGLSYLLNIVAPEIRLNSGISVKMATNNKEVLEADMHDTLYVDKVSVRWFRELDANMKLSHKDIGMMKDIPMLVMQGGDDLIVNKIAVNEWFNQVPLSEKRFKEWPKYYHEIFNDVNREEVFEYTKDFVHSQLKAIGYIV